MFAQALRLAHSWDYQTSSGISLTSEAIVSGGRNSLDIGVLDDSKTGLNQIYLTPIAINWAVSQSLHLSAAFAAFIPLGDFDRNALVNTTSNTASYVQEFSMTWFASSEWELSLSPTFTFNFKNDDTDYESGNVFNLDYFSGYRPASAPQWQIGLAGYYTKQFSDDKFRGESVGNGNRLQKFAIGPQVFYGLGPKTAFILKYLRETEVENSSQGQSIWFQFAMPL